MIAAHYWWDEGARLEQEACSAEDERRRAELLELAEICAEAAAQAEDRATGG